MFGPGTAAAAGMTAPVGGVGVRGSGGGDSRQWQAGAEAFAGAWPATGAATRSWARSAGTAQLLAAVISASRPASRRNEGYLTTASPDGGRCLFSVVSARQGEATANTTGCAVLDK